MATIDQIKELRLAIEQPANVEPWTDEILGGLIDSYGLNVAASKIWTIKASSVAKLVDISEGGSSRKNSQLFDHYTAIAASYGMKDVEATGGRRAATTRPIVRG
jgi:hypothetical protein